MGKVSALSIKFEKEPPIYFVGEQVNGIVQVTIAERLKINSVSAFIRGHARVHWTSRERRHRSGNNHRNNHSNYYTKHHTATEEYFRIDTSFLAKTDNQDLYLEIGDYAFPFAFALMGHLPTTFQHKLGEIKYAINATIDIPWAFDKCSIRSFSVVNPYDLNMFPHLRNPMGVSDIKTLCCGPCQSDPILIEFNTRKGGFVAGETIQFTAKVKNGTNKPLSSMKVSLIQKTSFHTISASKHVSRLLMCITYPDTVNPQAYDTWVGDLTIPAVAPSSNGLCRLINVCYELVLCINVGAMSINSNLPLQIVIGTTPLVETNALGMNGSTSFQSCSLGGENESTMPAEEKPSRSEMVESDEISFAPLYPYFKMSTSS